MLLQFLLLSLCVSVATAKVITGIFDSFNSLTWTNAASYSYRGPANPTWTAVIGWSLDGATASAGDTFTLDMPCVFKFITDQTSIDLVADGRTYATCNLNSAEEFTTFSSVSCTVTTTMTADTKAIGTVTLPFSFSVGGSGSDVLNVLLQESIQLLLMMVTLAFPQQLILKNQPWPPAIVSCCQEFYPVFHKL